MDTQPIRPMLRNDVRMALRALKKHHLYTGINVIGLAVGLSCCAFLLLYVLDEISYDRFHANAERIVRVVEDRDVEGVVARSATTYGPLAPALATDFPAVEQVARVLPYPLLINRDDVNRYQEDNVLFVDSTFFDVFTFDLVRGDERSVLRDPFSIVLTTSMARKYFGEVNPIGQDLEVRASNSSHVFTVSGIVADPPANTHLAFDFLASFSSMRTIHSSWIDNPENWEHPPLYTYALLRSAGDVEELEASMPAFALRHMGSRRVPERSLHIERLTDIRLHSNREGELRPGGDIAYVRLFGVVAVFILLIACINFTNMATARAASRAREVGMRKALGAARGQLVRQFLVESIILVGLALVLAVVAVQLFRPVFNAVAGKSFDEGMLAHWSAPIAFVAAALVTGLLAGGYPSLYLSRFRPTRVLKGVVTDAGSPAASRLRQTLVVFQFVVSIALTIGTVVVYQQLDYVQNRRLGFDKEHVVIVQLRDTDNQIHHESLKDALTRLRGVEAVTASSGMPGVRGGIYDWRVYPENAVYDSLDLMTLTVDHDYAEAYGLEIVAGRDFAPEFGGDATEGFILNESAARRLGWADPVGQRIALETWFGGHFRKEGTVVGVVRDFQYHSLHRSIEPMLLHIFPKTYYYDYMSVRIAPANMPETLAEIEQEWTRFNPERPFEYSFLDEQFDALYRSEMVLRNVFGIFAQLAILIACLGLFGMAAYTAQQRTKEIGVRKVLGATVAGLILLFSRGMLTLIGLAFVVATPLAYVAMDVWLDHFAYRVDIDAGVFLIAGAGALFIAWLTVSYHAVRSAVANPVDSLRYE